MRYHEIIEDDKPDGLMDYWELVAHFKLDSASDRLHDATIPWINYNDHRRITKLIANKKMRMLSKLHLFTDLSGIQNMSTKFATPQMFLEALSKPITLYRGGGGVYDPKYEYGLGWTSFTTSEKRVGTFSKYDGTRASRAYRLPLRDQYWVAKLTIPLDDILLYLPHGSDDEVIVSADVARQAQIETQTPKGQSKLKEGRVYDIDTGFNGVTRATRVYLNPVPAQAQTLATAAMRSNGLLYLRGILFEGKRLYVGEGQQVTHHDLIQEFLPGLAERDERITTFEVVNYRMQSITPEMTEVKLITAKAGDYDVERNPHGLRLLEGCKVASEAKNEVPDASH